MTQLPPSLEKALPLDAIAAKLASLRQEHRDLDIFLQRLQLDAGMDQLALRRLKKRKLMLKDQIEQLEMMLVPDIHA